MTPVLHDHVDILITTIEDMAAIYGWAAGNTAQTRSTRVTLAS